MNAFKDADIAWIVTNFWDPVSNIFFSELCNKYEKLISCKFSQLLVQMLRRKRDKVN